jgi:hypothetical protein
MVLKESGLPGALEGVATDESIFRMASFGKT